MRILHVIYAFDLGGAEESVTLLATGLATRGHECWVAAVNSTEDEDGIGRYLKDRLSQARVECIGLGGRNVYFNALLAPVRLALLVNKVKPDIVHSHTDIPDFIVSLALRLKKFAVARTMRNSSLWPTRRYSGFICETGFKNDLVVFISEATKRAYQDLRKKYLLPESVNQITIPNCVRPVAENEQLDRSYLVENFAADASKCLICFAGRFVRQKGFDILIEAVAGMAQHHLEKFEVHAFGRGGDLQSLMSKVERTGMPVRFHRTLPGISRLLPAFDAIVIPSRYEGLARVALEAMAAGVPVIATTAPGLSESLPPAWPLLVPAEDPTALRARLSDFLDGKFDIGELKKQGLDWFSENNFGDAVIGKHENAYRQFLASGKDLASGEDS